MDVGAEAHIDSSSLRILNSNEHRQFARILTGISRRLSVPAPPATLYVNFSCVIIHCTIVVKDGTSKTRYLWHVTSYIVSNLATRNRHQWHESIRQCQAVSYRVCWIRPYESSSWPFDIFDYEQFRDVTQNLCRCLPDLTAPKAIQTL